MSPTPTPADLVDEAFIRGSRAFKHAETVAAGLRFHYLHQGTGFPVILLPGFPQSSYAWRKVMPELASEYRVLAIDLPGQGDSDRPTDGYDTSTVVKRLDLFLSELAVDRFHLVGHDVGAWVAFAYAAIFGSKIQTLTLIDAGIPGITLRPEIGIQEARNRWHFLFQQIPDLAETVIAGREQAYIPGSSETKPPSRTSLAMMISRSIRESILRRVQWRPASNSIKPFPNRWNRIER
jgi:pimeloyl-ACP methyl ester carboxylesterase